MLSILWPQKYGSSISLQGPIFSLFHWSIWSSASNPVILKSNKALRKPAKGAATSPAHGPSDERGKSAMLDRGVANDAENTPNGQSPCEQAQMSSEPLEVRVRRLEDEFAAMRDTRELENRIVDRVVTRVGRRIGRNKDSTAAENMASAATGLNFGSGDEKSAQPIAGALAALRRPWLFWETVQEAQAMVRMFFDPRYRPSWLARVIPPVLLVMIATSWIWLPGTSILHSGFMTLIDKAVDLVLAFFAFKILHREVVRYREVIADLPIVPRS
jgi:hypothetical protein